ncbi:hypothetical protein EGT74_06835 [Chitinophaga lutea]|uniref:O-antigen ligase domain-containing protein n=1 Tax=Chitinophaga lutea TaxID=2488634 RepID=A0A3N4Q206_9BACT|nr:hypothetical protein [Chitinophaga lutea]RPE13239.1 hypothetical protein EGT74_06835 [Chitinophaga lutea]
MNPLSKDKINALSFRKNVSKWLVVTSGIYMVGLPLGFPHLMFVVSAVYLFMEKSVHAYFNRTSFNITVIALLFALVQLLVGAKLKSEINFLTSVLAFPITYELLKKFSLEGIIDISKKFIRFSTFMLSAEFVIRFILANLFPTSPDFYRFKFHSFMFQDTNFAGALILAVYFYAYFLSKRFKINLKFYTTILFILVFLSFSRAAMLALMLTHILFFQVKLSNIIPQILSRLAVVLGLVLVVLPYIIGQAMEDPSFRSKLYILGLYENSGGLSSVRILFGNGIGQTETVLEGLYAHNILLLYFLELGIIGCIAYILLIISIIYKSKGYSLYVYIPFLIAALSAVGHGLHYLYVVFALLCLIRAKEKQANI